MTYNSFLDARTALLALMFIPHSTSLIGGISSLLSETFKERNNNHSWKVRETNRLVELSSS